MDKVMVEAQQNRTSDKAFTILCIDDESSNLKVLSSVLKIDHQVILAKSATQGLEKAELLRPDLIILDVVMPHISGFDLIVKLKRDPQLRDIPVIFITGLNSIQDEEKGLLLGACDYIHKPFNHSIIRARVNTHLEIVRQRRLLEKFANFDSLTELPNRRKWQQDIEQMWSLATVNQDEVLLGIIDVDYFKAYNDLYGHQQGDIVLRKVASALNRAFFEHKGRVYRCGGEEFFFYLPSLTRAQNQKILSECLNLVRSLAITHEKGTSSQVVTVSIGGTYLIPKFSDLVDDVLKVSDELLYQVKADTRNNYSLAAYTRA